MFAGGISPSTVRPRKPVRNGWRGRGRPRGPGAGRLHRGDGSIRWHDGGDTEYLRRSGRRRSIRGLGADDPAERHVTGKDTRALRALAARHGCGVPRGPPGMTVAAFVVLTGGMAGFRPSKRQKLSGARGSGEGTRRLSHAVIVLRAMQNRDGGEWSGDDPESGVIDGHAPGVGKRGLRATPPGKPPASGKAWYARAEAASRNRCRGGWYGQQGCAGCRRGTRRAPL